MQRVWPPSRPLVQAARILKCLAVQEAEAQAVAPRAIQSVAPVAIQRAPSVAPVAIQRAPGLPPNAFQRAKPALLDPTGTGATPGTGCIGCGGVSCHRYSEEDDEKTSDAAVTSG